MPERKAYEFWIDSVAKKVVDHGPRLGPYIIERGKAEVIEKLKKAI